MIVEFTKNDWNSLSTLNFIPITKNDKQFLSSPPYVYFGSSSSQLYGEHFIYIGIQIELI